MLVRTSEGKTKDVSILKPNSNEYQVTEDNYIVPKGEEGKYHVIIEIPQFSPVDGTRLSQPRLQKFGEKWFDSMGGESDLKKQGYKLIVLHDPKEWLKENAESDAQRKAEKAKAALEAKQKQEAEKAEAEKAERQSEIQAGIKAALEAMGITAPIKTNQVEEKADTVKSVNVQNPSTGKTTEVKTEEKPQVKAEEKQKPSADADKK